MQLDKTFSFEEFTARKAAQQTGADLDAQLTESIRLASERQKAEKAAARKPRKPAAPTAEAAPPATLADLLKQAVALAMRPRREAREVIVREQVLLEVLTDAMRRDA